MPTDQNRFPKEERLLKRADFLRLSSEGQKVHVPHFIVLSSRSDTPCSRVGITVSRKVGNAVVRNRVKRLVREFCRHNRRSPGTDYSIIAKPGSGILHYLQVCRELEKAFARLAGER
ncbi:MAG TPA: ribonuclease P protein component [Verrucomicrobiae bacterium]|nr:ribonuclease P protein component [Verrucomicrobiae bacterium]